MATIENSSLIDQLIEPISDCLTPEVARRIVGLRASQKMQSRVDDLADKANAGTLTPRERADYEQYVRFWQFITFLQLKARDRLDEVTEPA